MYKSDLGGTLDKVELDVYSSRLGGFLQSKGIGKGDRVAVMMPNILQYPICIKAIHKIGAVLVNINPLYTRDELHHTLVDSGAKAIIAFNGASVVLDQSIEDTDVTTVVATAVGDMVPGFKGNIINVITRYTKGFDWPDSHHIRFGEIIWDPKFTADEPPIHRSDLAMIQYTGATTGLAKGVEITHAMLTANVRQIIMRMGNMFGEGDVVVSPLPLYHVYAYIVSQYVEKVGGSSLLVANPRDIPKFVKTLQAFPFTGFIGLNTLFNALMKHKDFERIDFSELKSTISGGMPLTKDIADRWQTATGSSICEGYGLTETSPVLCLNDPYAPTIGAVGKPVDGVRVKIASNGEILVKGPNVFKRYWNNPEASKAAFTFMGWFRTGDVGHMKDGYLYITDRIKNLIIVSGFNVYPAEVEDVIVTHPKISEAGVIGEKDGKGNEKVVAFCVKVEDDVSEMEVRDFCKDHLTKYKVPSEVRFIAELPKTPVGKVLHRKLKEMQG